MVEFTLDKTTSVLHIRPTGALGKTDFERLAAEVDPYIEQHGDLAGLLLEIEKFPGWENFAAALRHFRFVREHHKKIKKVAVVTDTLVGALAEHIGAHFISARVRHFPASQLSGARDWLTEE